MLDFELIRQAQARLKGHHIVTPLLEYEPINEMLGGRVLFKAEILQKTGSFKFRGAFNKIAALAPDIRTRGVVTYSSGNHAQGVAAAARHFGIAATVVMPSTAPLLKRQNTERLGAKLVLYDIKTGDRKAIAEAISVETGATIIAPYDDEMVMAGQGTIGLEIAEQLEQFPKSVKRFSDKNCGEKQTVETQISDSIESHDLLLAPIGGGGLMAGVSTALRHLMPDMQLYCVEPEGFDDTKHSLERGERVANQGHASSLCDAIITPTPGELTFPINLRTLTGGFAVDDASVMRATRVLFEVAKLVVEPGGAVGLAALLDNKLALQGRSAVIILSGGNLDLSSFISMCQAQQSDPAPP